MSQDDKGDMNPGPLSSHCSVDTTLKGASTLLKRVTAVDQGMQP